ncbi:NADH-quinone oxidoreductase subunit J [Planctomycetota bacterium]
MFESAISLGSGGLGLLASAESGGGSWNSGGLYVLAFYLFAALAVVPGIFLLMVRDVVRAAFLLLGSLSGVAGLYALLGAEFIAFAQVLVYIGGILILLLFGVMLTNREPILLHGAPTHQLVLPGVIVGAVSLVGLLYVATSYSWQAAPIDSARIGYSAKNLGFLLMTDYVLPFEIASVLLLVALIGAAMIARRKGLTQEPE